MDRIRNYNGFHIRRRVEMNDPNAIPAESDRISTKNCCDRLGVRIYGRFKDCSSIGDDPIDDWLERKVIHSPQSLLQIEDYTRSYFCQSGSTNGSPDVENSSALSNVHSQRSLESTNHLIKVPSVQLTASAIRLQSSAKAIHVAQLGPLSGEALVAYDFSSLSHSNIFYSHLIISFDEESLLLV
jgi:hypothetical protein